MRATGVAARWTAQGYKVKWKCIPQCPLNFGDADSWQASTIPNVPKENGKREEFLLNIVKDRNAEIANKYGNEKGSKIKYAEALELCQYGRQATIEELNQMFGTTQ